MSNRNFFVGRPDATVSKEEVFGKERERREKRLNRKALNQTYRILREVRKLFLITIYRLVGKIQEILQFMIMMKIMMFFLQKLYL